eukprot:evm.model.NODE_235_length_25475_cov_36.991245.12
MGSALSEEEFQQLQDVVASASDDTTKPQLALSFFKERETGKGNRKAHLSASQLSHLVSLTTSFGTKKSLVLLLGPYLCADVSNYKAIVDLFPNTSDVSSVLLYLVECPGSAILVFIHVHFGEGMDCSAKSGGRCNPPP